MINFDWYHLCNTSIQLALWNGLQVVLSHFVYKILSRIELRLWTSCTTTCCAFLGLRGSRRTTVLFLLVAKGCLLNSLIDDDTLSPFSCQCFNLIVLFMRTCSTTYQNNTYTTETTSIISTKNWERMKTMQEWIGPIFLIFRYYHIN